MASRPNRYYAGPASDHFDGARFFDFVKPRNRDFRAFLKWQMNRRRSGWPARENVPEPPFAIPSNRVAGDRLVVTGVGHATVLIQTQGLNILIDPLWSKRASPLSWWGPRRRQPPGIRFGDLPDIDIVFVSHNHYDHLDLPTLARLHQRFAPLIVAPLGNDAIIHRKIESARTAVLDWGGRLQVSEAVAFHLLPAQHWSARGIRDTNHALWGALAIEAPGGNLYAVPDTGFGGGRYFRLARDRFGPFRFAMLPIGAYEPRWFMSYAHMMPEEALDAAAILEARCALATHYNVFPLADDGFDEARQRLVAERTARNLPPEALRDLGIGESWEVPALQAGVNEVVASLGSR